MNPRRWIICGAVLGGLAVGLGALGAHGLQGYLRTAATSGPHAERLSEILHSGVRDEPRVERLRESYETAVRYHLAHALAIIAIGLTTLAARPRMLAAAGWCFLVGTVLFSGFLYAWVFTLDQHRFLVHVVPIGGSLLVLGWILLAGAHCCPGRER